MAHQHQLTLSNIISAARNDSLDSLLAAPPASASASAPPPPPRELQIFTDGSVRPWGPHAGCAYTFYSRSDHLWHGEAFALGAIADSNVAEKWAIFAALDACRELSGLYDHFTIKTDCRWAMEDIQRSRKGKPRPGDSLALDIAEKIRRLESEGKQVSLRVIPGHQSDYESGGNRTADLMAGRASFACGHDAFWREQFWLVPEWPFWEQVWE